MELVLQVCGGFFYLLSKMFFSATERAKSSELETKWRIASWQSYLIGLPFILVLFWIKSNWMAFAVEAAGSVGMIYGLVAARRGLDGAPKWLEWLAYASAAAGIAVSVWYVGFFTQASQLFELGTTIGFLFGTVLAGKQRASGYLWYMFMNATTCGLSINQGWYVFAVQQVLSFAFMFDAWRNKVRANRPAKNFLITGEPGVGKSTLIKKLIDYFRADVGGFWTEELTPNGGERTGFVMHSLVTQRISIIAHIDQSATRTGVHGRYRVALDVICRVAIDDIRSALFDSGIVVIDEVGFMQLKAHGFADAVRMALDSRLIVLATVPTASHPETDAMKTRSDTMLVVVTEQNRDELFQQIVALVEAQLH